MRKNLLVAALLASAISAFGQGSINFNNRVTTGTAGSPQGPVVAPIFGVDTADPFALKKGNPASDWNGTNGPTPVPSGGQTYGGAPLRGTGFTAQLWGANANKTDAELVLVATTTFKTLTAANQAGFIANPTAAPIVTDTPSSASERAKFQLRVWDNQGGTILTWDQALSQWQAGRIAVGTSDIFTVPFQLGLGTTLPPTLQGLQSFQLTMIPEPSVIALGILGAGCLFLLRRRK